MILTAEENEPAESELAPRVESIARASLDPASETRLDIPPTAVDDGNHCVLRRGEGERTLASIIAENGTLPDDHARRIILGVCDALRAAPKSGLRCGDLRPEWIIVDSEGRIRFSESNSRFDSTENIDYVAALTALFCEMVIGRVPCSASDYSELYARLSPRLREIIQRSVSLDPSKRYAGLDDFVHALRREERIEFYQAFTIGVVLFAVWFVLYAVHYRS